MFHPLLVTALENEANAILFVKALATGLVHTQYSSCLLYTSDAADDLLCVDLGGRRIINTKKNEQQ